MIVKIKRLNEKAVIPQYAKAGDAGLDLTATAMEFDKYGNVVYHTGIAIEIPDGYVGLVFPRSSNCKKDLALTNSVGVIDSGYRGEITFKFRLYKSLFDSYKYDVGERVGQLIIMPYPKIEFEEVEELTETERGASGYGSSGK